MLPRLLQNLAPPDLVSLINAALGLAAIGAISEGYTAIGASLIILCGIADGLDGLTAHYTDTSEIGVHVDSIVDAISFGVAPVYLVFTITKHEGVALASISIVFTIAAVIRLASYNRYDSDKPGFTGAPSTLAGTLIAALFLTEIPGLIHPMEPYLFISLSVILAYMMLLDITYPDIQDLHAVAMGGLMFLAAIQPNLARSLFPSMILAALVIYLVFSPWFYPGKKS